MDLNQLRSQVLRGITKIGTVAKQNRFSEPIGAMEICLPWWGTGVNSLSKQMRARG